jgi:hypothetical protein
VQNLRSWLKQERLAAGSSRWVRTLRTGTLLVLLLIGLEGLRRYRAVHQQLG